MQEEVHAHIVSFEEKKPDGYTLTLSAQTLSDIDVAFTVKGHGLEQTATVTARNGTAQAVFAGLDVTIG